MSAGRMPLLFVGHGSPMNALADNPWTRTWAELGRRLQQPEAILCLSAHYETSGLCAVDLELPETIHNFYGFPKALYDIRYPAPGSPEMARRAVSLLGGSARTARDWGLDHGAWSVLRVMYPQADIPVVQLSLDLSRSAGEQMMVGKLLQPLREEGILLVGSGNIVHNLREIRPGQPEPFPWAQAFSEAVHSLVMSGQYQEVSQYQSLPGAAPSVNSGEHFVPLLNILGAADAADVPESFNHDLHWGSLSMTGYVLSEKP